MRNHLLKTWQPWFDDVAAGRKTFDLRRNDRGFQVGDLLTCQAFDPKTNEYVPGVCLVRVIYMVTEHPGLRDGYCLMGIELDSIEETETCLPSAS